MQSRIGIPRAAVRAATLLATLIALVTVPADAWAFTGGTLTRTIYGHGTLQVTNPVGPPDFFAAGSNPQTSSVSSHDGSTSSYQDCQTTGDSSFSSTDCTVTVREVTPAGWQFSSWGGDCSGAGTGSTCTLTTYTDYCDFTGLKPQCAQSSNAVEAVAHFSDTRAPTTTFNTAPAASSVVYSDTSSQTFTWSTDEDDEAPTAACKRDAGVFSACSSGLTWSSISDGIHTFCVHNTDASGLQGADRCRQWEQETNPTAAITAHPPAVTSSSSATFAYTSNKATHPADGSTLSYECRVDAAASFASCPSSYTGLADGSHTFQVRAVFTGALGGGAHTSPAASYTWTVDATPPTLSLTSGPADGSVVVAADGHAAFGFTGSDQTTGVSEVRCSLDSGAYGPCTSSTSEVLDAVADGEHVLRIRATDGAGNETVETVHWEQEAPAETVIDSGPAAGSLVGAGPVHFTFHSTKTGTAIAFQCAIDAGAFGACSGAQADDLTGLASGSHTFQVRAVFTASIDGSQHAGPAVSRTFAVDATPPVAPRDPSVSATWKLRKHATRVRSLIAANVPAGATVTLTCRGPKHSCAFKRKAVHVTAQTPKLPLTSAFKGRGLAAGTKITVTITTPGARGLVVSARVRSGKRPAIVRRTLPAS